MPPPSAHHDPRVSSYRSDIDGLRAVAVCGVIAYHAFPRLCQSGFVGVDIFFVISGFLISGIILRDIEKGRFSFLEFYRRRIRRILPALLVVLAAVWAMGWFILMPEDYRVLGWHVSAASVFLSNLVLGRESGYFDKAVEFKPLLHLWSLAVEEQFYLLWPITLLILRNRQLRLVLILSGCVILSFGLHIIAVQKYPVWDFYSLPTRLWELALGAVIASVDGNRVPGRVRDAMAAIGVTFVLISIFALKGQSNQPGWTLAVPTLGTALLILADKSWVSTKILSIRPIVLIGLISYPLYLWHWPLLSFSRISHLGEPSPLFKVIMIGLATGLSWATYEFIEKPIRFGRHFNPNWRPYIPTALLAFLCFVGAIGLMTFNLGGFASRFPDPVNSLARYTFDQGAYRVGTCLLSTGQTENNFGAMCSGRTVGDQKPLIFLWGDSHAGHLYPGLKEKEGRYSIAQFNTSGCPPIIGLDVKETRFCRQINEFVIHKIEEMKPEVIVLAAQWWEVSSDDLGKIENSISHLKRIQGIKVIVLVGPVPVWNPSLPERLIDYYKKSVPKHVPDRMVGAALQPDIERTLRDIAARYDVAFVSPSDLFCRPDGCLTRAGDGEKEPVAWDSAHLTNAGSRVVATQIYATIEAAGQR